MKIADCTIRDGGYYTDWEFDDELINLYLNSMNNLPVDFVEIGYRGNPLLESSSYKGKFYYLPEKSLEDIRLKLSSKNISIMLNAKEWPYYLEELEKNLMACKGYVDIFRVAANPDKINESVEIANIIAQCGYQAFINIMYSHKLLNAEYDYIIQYLQEHGNNCTGYYLVDSYGTLLPDDVEKLILSFKSKFPDKLIGFHGHDNIELAFANSLYAQNAGADFVDGTVTGMGRGAGNLKIELLLSYLGVREKWQVDFEKLSEVVDMFDKCKKEYNWGTNLSYMISGQSAVPQKNVVDLINTRRYTTNTIVKSLMNENTADENPSIIEDNEVVKASTILLVGGGKSVEKTMDYINQFLYKFPEIIVIHSSVRNINLFDDMPNKQYVCLTGDEINKHNNVNKKINLYDSMSFVIPKNPPVPVSVPEDKHKKVVIDTNHLLNKNLDSPLAVSLSTAHEMEATKIYMVGFDGYSMNDTDNAFLHIENQNILNTVTDKLNLITLTPSTYNGLSKSSIYKF